MKKQRFSAEYIAFLCSELKLTIRSGLSLNEAFAVMAEEEPDKTAAETLKIISQKLENGDSLQEAIESSQCFPKHVADMVGIGYSTGYLEEVFEQLAKYYDREARLKESARNAVAYPAVLLVMMICVAAILILKVLPVFKSVFDQLGGSMSGLTSFMMNAGLFISAHAAATAVILLILAAAFTAFAVKKHREGCATVFITKRMQRSAGSAGFAAAMSMAVSSGLSIDEAVEIASNMEFDKETSAAIVGIKSAMDEGMTFAESIAKSTMFSSAYNRMIALADRSGSMDAALSEISERMDRTLNDDIESLISKIEPALVITLSVFTGVILLSVMLPLINIMSSII